MKKIWNVLVDRRLLWLLLACICPLACRLEGQRPQLREIDQELAAAIDSGDFARSKGLIAKGADVDTFGSAGHSLLFYAAQSGSAKEMTWLLMHDASVNGVDKAGDVPLSVAVAGNRVEAAKVLLEWGADPDGEYPDPIPNERENAGTRSHPLHIAVKKAGMEMVDLLLRHGAVPNAKDGEGRTALFAAAEAGKTDVVRRLLASGVSACQADDRGDTPLAVAATVDVTEALMAGGARVDAYSETGHLPIHWAAFNGRAAVVELFLKKGMSPDVSVKMSSGIVAAASGVKCIPWAGSTPLHAAARGGHAAVVDLLLARGAHVKAANRDGSTPLHLAAQHGRTGIAATLLKSGAPVEAKDKEGQSPLHLACKAGSLETVKLLLSAKASVEAAAENGWTAITFAAAGGNPDVVSLLLNAGAIVKPSTTKGYSPLHAAVESKNIECIRRLREAGCDVRAKDTYGNEPLHLCATADAAEYLLAHGAAANARNAGDRTPLYEAMDRSVEVAKVLLAHGVDPRASCAEREQTPLALCSSPELATLLLDKGANPNARDSSGGTPLHAATMNYLAVAHVLLTHGADPNAKDNEGETPLHLANSAQAIAMLLAFGADPNARTKGGDTPLHMGRGQEAVRLLVAKGAQVNARGARGCTPLMAALRSQGPGMSNVGPLIRAGADVNVCDAEGNSPLHEAVYSGPGVVSDLVGAGAKVNAKDSANSHPKRNRADKKQDTAVEVP